MFRVAVWGVVLWQQWVGRCLQLQVYIGFTPEAGWLRVYRAWGLSLYRVVSGSGWDEDPRCKEARRKCANWARVPALGRTGHVFLLCYFLSYIVHALKTRSPQPPNSKRRSALRCTMLHVLIPRLHPNIPGVRLSCLMFQLLGQ